MLLSAQQWHVQLEGALQKLDAVHESFRLWITAEPHPAFPIGLLQMGIKVTNEAPVGMKAGLRASYQWITQVGDSNAGLLATLNAGKPMCNAMCWSALLLHRLPCRQEICFPSKSSVVYMISTDIIMQDMLDAVNRNEWRQLLFLEAFLHSVVQERRKFGPIGWNVPYEFNLSDLSACVHFLQVLSRPSHSVTTQCFQHQHTRA